MSDSAFKLNYILASCMYGTTPLDQILPAVSQTGATHIEIWPRVHGDQREQVEAMGHAAFADLLERHRVQLGISTRFDLGPFDLEREMDFARLFGASLLVCGSKGPKGLTGSQLRTAVAGFARDLQPNIAAATERGLTIAIENHGNALIESPDSIKWLVDFANSPNLGIALAPYHLPNEPDLVVDLVESLGTGLALFYAWQHGMGCHEPRPREEELMQLPGRGTLNFNPILAALKKIDYQGWTEIFMHPVPRGIPVLPTVAEVTSEINRARNYLDTIVEGQSR